MRYRFKETGHINLQEGHVFKGVCKRVSWGRRLVTLQDRNVVLGVGLKGRSSSQALNRTTSKTATEILGCDLYPKGWHTPTWSLCAGHPSRVRALYRHLACAGRHGRSICDLVYVRVCRTEVTRSTPCRLAAGPSFAGCRWLLAWLLLASCCWGAGASRPPRKGRVVEAIRQPAVGTATARARDAPMLASRQFLEDTLEMTYEKFVRGDQALITQTVRKCVWHAYANNWSNLRFRDLLVEISEEIPWLRPCLTAGWRVVARWEELVPSVPRTPLPETLFHAALSILLAWGWLQTLVTLWLGYYGLLRLRELCSLKRTEVLMPDGNHDEMLIRIRSP